MTQPIGWLIYMKLQFLTKRKTFKNSFDMGFFKFEYVSLRIHFLD